jgi:hypothetical protein
MPSDTPTTELTTASVAFLLEHRGYAGCTMASLTIRERLEVIEAEAVRSFAERVRPFVRHRATCQLQAVRDNAPDDELCTCGLRDLWLQAETPDASDSGEAGTCPGPDCPYCAGEMCARFDGLGCTHDVIERHGYREPRP